MWIYKLISRLEFEKRKDFVEQIMMELGCEAVEIELPYVPKTTSFGVGCEEICYTERMVYKFQNGYYRVDEVLFPEKPFIVLEYADTLNKVIENIMEDCDPFPYDLSDADIIKEVRYSLGIEPYPHN